MLLDQASAFMVNALLLSLDLGPTEGIGFDDGSSVSWEAIFDDQTGHNVGARLKLEDPSDDEDEQVLAVDFGWDEIGTIHRAWTRTVALRADDTRKHVSQPQRLVVADLSHNGFDGETLEFAGGRFVTWDTEWEHGRVLDLTLVDPDTQESATAQLYLRWDEFEDMHRALTVYLLSR